MVYSPDKIGSATKSPYRRGMQTAQGTMDVDQFTELMNGLLKKAWGEDWGKFIQKEPTSNDPEKLVLPVIVYDTQRRVPSTSHPSPDPILFDKIKDEDHEGTFLNLYRQWFDMEINFWIYHQTNRDATILMAEFEAILFEYKDYFKDLGISDIKFQSEEPPQIVQAWGKDLPQRNLVYLIRLERVLTSRLNSTKVIDPVVLGQDEAYASSRKKETPLMKAYREQFNLND